MTDSSTCSDVEIHIGELDRSLFAHLLSMKEEKGRKRLMIPFIPEIRGIADDGLSDACIDIDADKIFVQEKRVYGRVWVHVHVKIGSISLWDLYQVALSTLNGELVCLAEEIDGVQMYTSAQRMLSCLCIDAFQKKLKKMRENI